MRMLFIVVLLLTISIAFYNNYQKRAREEKIESLEFEISQGMGDYSSDSVRIKEKDSGISITYSAVGGGDIDYALFSKYVEAISASCVDVIKKHDLSLNEIDISFSKPGTKGNASDLEIVSWRSQDGVRGTFSITKGTSSEGITVQNDISPQDLLEMYSDSTPKASASPFPILHGPITPLEVNQTGDSIEYVAMIPTGFSNEEFETAYYESIESFLKVYPIEDFEVCQGENLKVTFLDSVREKRYMFYFNKDGAFSKSRSAYSDPDKNGTLKSEENHEGDFESFPNIDTPSGDIHTPIPNVKGTVYWTQSGEKYHSTSSCATLKRSKKIKSGSISQAKDSGHKTPCSICCH